MLKIVAACGNGMGTSMIIKLKVEKICKSLNVQASVEALSIGQAKGLVNSADIIICSKHLSDNFDSTKKAKIVGIQNLMDEKEIEAGLGKVLNE
ncbi:MAG: PTS sugar transporter subunit IIB [Malacoplasma sp.]|nr:PTS sugar transporter subunit IIB [Malacoplasma sp.]